MHNSKHILYAAAVVTNVYSNSMIRLSILTTKFKEMLDNKLIPQSHSDSAATSLFLANKHKYLRKELCHEEINVRVANTNKMNLVTTRRLQLALELPMEAQNAHGFKKWTDH